MTGAQRERVGIGGIADEPSGWSFVEDGAQPAWCLDRELRYRRVNGAWVHRAQAARAAFGASGSWPMGQCFLDHLYDGSRGRWESALRAIVAGELGHHADHSQPAAFASSGPTGRGDFCVAGPTYGPDGRPDGVMMVAYGAADGGGSGSGDDRVDVLLGVARKLQHHLGNQLSLTMGYVELLTIDARLPAELRERVDEALRGAIEATETLNYLRLLAREEIDPHDPSIAAYLRRGERREADVPAER